MPTANPSSFSKTERDQQRGNGPRTIHALVERLTEFDGGDGWVVSCFLKLEPRDRTRGKYLIKVKNRIKDRLAWLENRGVSRAERKTVEDDLKRVYHFLEERGNLPEGRGIAVFASGERDLFESIPLPQVFRSRLAVDRTPLIRELAALDDEYGLVVCAVYDRMKARFFKVTAFDVEEHVGAAPEEVARAGKFRGKDASTGYGLLRAGAMGEANYHQRIREEKQRHYAVIAHRLFHLARAAPIRGIVLAGMGPDAAAVEPHLHPYLRDQLIGHARLNPKNATASEVMSAVLGVRRKKEREWEAEHVRQLEEGLGNRWAVNGVEPSLRALAHGQVRTLLVDPTVAEGGYRCADSNRLTVRQDGCRAEGEAEPVPDVIDEAIEEALQQGCHVDVVEGDSSGVDGLAALLRFKQR